MSSVIQSSAVFLKAVEVWASQPRLPTSRSSSLSSLSDAPGESPVPYHAKELRITDASYDCTRAPSLPPIAILDDQGGEMPVAHVLSIVTPPKYRKFFASPKRPFQGHFKAEPHSDYTFITDKRLSHGNADGPSLDIQDGIAPSPRNVATTSTRIEEGGFRILKLGSISDANTKLKADASVRPPRRGVKRKYSEGPNSDSNLQASTTPCAETKVPSGTDNISAKDVPATQSTNAPTENAAVESRPLKRPKRVFEKSDRILRSTSTTSKQKK